MAEVVQQSAERMGQKQVTDKNPEAERMKFLRNDRRQNFEDER